MDDQNLHQSPEKRMFRFTLRELFLLILLVALSLGWWLDHSRNAAERERLTLNLWEQILRVRVLEGQRVQPATAPTWKPLRNDY